MASIGKAARLGLALLLTAFAGACAPSTPDFPRAATTAPLPRATSRAPASPPAAPVFAVPSTATAGATQTPPAVAVRAVEEAPEIAGVLSSLSALGRQLNGNLIGQMEDDRILSSAQRAAALMAETSRLMPQMSPPQRKQAFSHEASLAEGLVRVLGAREDTGDLGPTVPEGTPRAAEGMLLDIAGLPSSAPAPEVQVIAQDLARVQTMAANLAKGKPTSADATSVLTSLQWRILAVERLSEQLPAQDVQQLAAGTAAAMQANAAMVGAHLGASR